MSTGILIKKPKVPTMHLLIAIVVMWGSVVAAEWMKPRNYWADAVGEPRYETLIPTRFGEWEQLPEAGGRVVSPAQEEYLLSLYSEIYAHSFVHKPTGRVLMLSIAYGRDQTNDSQIHTPDACYPSQGFRVDKREQLDLQTSYGPIKAVRLATSMGAQRKEPLTYFIRVGDAIVRGSKERNLQRLAMAVRGFKVDGMLFRVSEITGNPAPYALQDQFIDDLLSSVGAEARQKIIGGK